MKISIICCSNDTGGSTIAVYAGLDEANSAATEWVEANWTEWFGRGGAICPTPWKRAYDILTDQTGFVDELTLVEIPIASFAPIKEARATLEQCIERLEMNNYDGEEDPFIADCETALEMLA